MSRPRRPGPADEPTQPAVPPVRRPPPPAAPYRRPSPAAPGTQRAERGGRAKDSRWVTALLASVIAVSAVMAGAILVLGFWKPGYFVKTRLDINEVIAGAQSVITDSSTGYGLTGASVTSCNGGKSPTITVGLSFTCEVSVDGAVRTVVVTIEDAEGTYGVSAPR